MDRERDKLYKRDAALQKRHRTTATELGSALKLGDIYDYLMVLNFLNQRHTRAKIYEDKSAIKSYFQSPNTFRLFLANRRLSSFKENVLFLEHQLVTAQLTIKDQYPTPEDRQHLRNIELAVGDIVARSDSQKPVGKSIRINPDLIPEWAERWSPKVSGRMLPSSFLQTAD